MGTMPRCIDRTLHLPALQVHGERWPRVQAVLAISRQHAAPEASAAASTAEAIRSDATPCAAQQLVHACIADMQQRLQAQQAEGGTGGAGRAWCGWR